MLIRSFPDGRALWPRLRRHRLRLAPRRCDCKDFPPNSAAGILAFAADGRRLLSTHPEAKTLRLWDVESGKELRQFVGHTGSVSFAVFTTGGGRALSSGDGTIRLWDVETGKELHCFKKPGGYLAVSPGGAMSCTEIRMGRSYFGCPTPPPPRRTPAPPRDP